MCRRHGSAARDVDIIVADRLTEAPGEVFERLPKLRALVRCAVDIRNIDVAAAAAGVLVTRAGPGFIAMGMDVLVADPFTTVDDARIGHVPLEELLGRADYVVCLAVATEATENLIGRDELARMQPHAFFINLSRGNLLDEIALLAVLREKRIAGAAIDVGRARDQMPTMELARLSSVIATPHIGGLTPPAIESQSLETVRQVEAIIGGEAPLGAVNAEYWTRRP